MADRDFVDAPVRVPEKASLFEDFIDIFTAPSKVYARRADGNFWLILLILTVLFAVLAFAGRATYQTLMEMEFQRGAAAQNTEMTEEQLAQARRFGSMFGMFAMYVAVPVMVLLFSIVVWIVGKIFGAALTYGQAAVIVAYSQIPRLLGSVVFLVQGMLIDPATSNGFMSYSIGPARFVDPAANAGLAAFLARFDLLNVIWPTILLGIGIAVIGKVPREKGYMAAAVLWLVGSLGALFALARGA